MLSRAGVWPPCSAGHQTTARRRADTTAGVCLGESQALSGKSIDVCGVAICLLAITAQIAIAQVVGHDEDDVRLRRAGGVRHTAHECEREECDDGESRA